MHGYEGLKSQDTRPEAFHGIDTIETISRMVTKSIHTIIVNRQFHFVTTENTYDFISNGRKKNSRFENWKFFLSPFKLFSANVKLFLLGRISHNFSIIPSRTIFRAIDKMAIFILCTRSSHAVLFIKKCIITNQQNIRV